MVFGTYSKYYDLLYKDKDYACETRYVHDLIQKYRPGTKTILDLGCGTGRHDIELAKLGYEVTGVDISADMLSIATQRIVDLGTPASSVQFIHGNICTVRLEKTFDFCIEIPSSK